MKTQLKNLIIHFYTSDKDGAFPIEHITKKRGEDQYVSFKSRDKQINSHSRSQSSRINTNLF